MKLIYRHDVLLRGDILEWPKWGGPPRRTPFQTVGQIDFSEPRSSEDIIHEAYWRLKAEGQPLWGKVTVVDYKRSRIRRTTVIGEEEEGPVQVAEEQLLLRYPLPATDAINHVEVFDVPLGKLSPEGREKAILMMIDQLRILQNRSR